MVLALGLAGNTRQEPVTSEVLAITAIPESLLLIYPKLLLYKVLQMRVFTSWLCTIAQYTATIIYGMQCQPMKYDNTHEIMFNRKPIYTAY